MMDHKWDWNTEEMLDGRHNVGINAKIKKK